ncbi:MAG: hypothetical protein KAS04_02340, partial [Candidatus Aenigmarchaeota archaeon]|nr:hypothetical protein [Candidatus Aenigmarchaeota archaeon]
MIFQILDIDYTLVNEKPIIRIFGKTESGETICGFVEGFEPYFYISGDNIEEALEDEGNVVRVEEVEKYFHLGYQTKKSKFHKIVLKNPAKTPEIRERLIAKGFKVFEADIPFKYRFMADYDLKGMEWIEIEEENGVNTTTVKTKKCVKIKKLKRFDKVGMVPLKHMALDIECVSLRGGEMPDGKKDPIIMISFAFNETYKGAKDMVLSTRPGEGVVYCETEKDMLESMVNIIMDFDPDTISGYNINNFDMPYILDRMKDNEMFPNFGRCNKMVRTRQMMNRFKTNIIGRI